MKRIVGLVVALCMAVSVGVFADSVAVQPQRIGVVDLQKIMQTSAQMKLIQQKLEKEFKPRRDKLVAMEESLKKDMETFKRESAVMGQNKKKEMERKIVATQQAFERDGQQYQQQLSTAHNDAMEEFYGKVRKAISVVAAKKYDLILQKDAAPFSSAQLDITDQVLKEIN